MNDPFEISGCLDCGIPIVRIIVGIVIFLGFALAARGSINSERSAVVRWGTAGLCIVASFGGLVLAWYDW